jgi:hypothetical protein
MNQAIAKLIPAIVSEVVDRGGYVTKTKLLKLLYLFDVEYYRVFRKTFTEFDWKFFHLGPWTAEYDTTLNSLINSGDILQQASGKSEYDTQFFRVPDKRDFSKLFATFAEEAPLRKVLNIWSEASTGEILDHIYFRTEPMEHGVRNTRLDFSYIPEELPTKYTRTSSGVDPRQIKRLREKLRARLSEATSKKTFPFTPPRYDDQFETEMSRLGEKRD